MPRKFLVSYCVTCMDRLAHLQATLCPNLYMIRNLPVEIVVLDYGSSGDDLIQWVCGLYRQWSAPSSSEPRPDSLHCLSVYRFNLPEVYHSSHAKNMARRLAQGSILCNLDADTYLMEGLTEMLCRELGDGGKFAAPADHAFYDRIALRREDFFDLGGYDEQMTGYAYDDTDLCKRATMRGLTRVPLPDSLNVRIPHGREDRMKNFLEKDSAVSIERNSRVVAGRLHWKVNEGREIGAGSVWLVK